MARFDFTLDETSIGQTIGPPDGFLVSLVMTTPPVNDGPPRWNEGSRRWVSGYFVLRGSGDTRDLYCARSGFVSNVLIQDHSLGYSGRGQRAEGVDMVDHVERCPECPGSRAAVL